MKSLPFRRVEYVPTDQQGAALIESHCAFCAFVAVSKEERIVDMAEAAHECRGMRRFRELGRQE